MCKKICMLMEDDVPRKRLSKGLYQQRMRIDNMALTGRPASRDWDGDMMILCATVLGLMVPIRNKSGLLNESIIMGQGLSDTMMVWLSMGTGVLRRE